MVHRFAYILQKTFPDWYTKKGGFWDVFVPYIWNHKWLQSKVMYPTISGKRKVDIKSVFMYNYLLQGVAKNITKNCKTNDQKAYKIWQWVTKNIRYQSDYRMHKRREYWQIPSDTYLSLKGDCEDGAILMVRMWLDAGIPAHQCKLCAGYVEVNKKAVGHAYAIYLKEHTKDWIIMDWCYWQHKIPSRWRFNKSHADCPEYKEIWWTTNDKISWAQHDIIMRDGLHD